MPSDDISHTEEEYLEVFFWFLEYGSSHVKTNQIAEMMNVHPGTVTSMLRKLSRRKLIKYTPYYGAELTSKGKEIALKVVRNHRLAESFLYWLGLPWSRIHEEACKWEHVLTDEIAAMIEQKIKLPERGPSGAFTPKHDGTVETIPTKQPLALFEKGNKVEIVEILERVIARHMPKTLDLQDIFEELEEKNLLPGQKLTIISVKTRTNVKIEMWSHLYATDMVLEDKSTKKINVPYYLVNMILARKANSD